MCQAQEKLRKVLKRPSSLLCHCAVFCACADVINIICGSLPSIHDLNSEHDRRLTFLHPLLCTVCVSRLYRAYYEARSNLQAMWRGNPALTAVLFGLPMGFFALICYSICCADIMDAEDEDEDGEREWLL